MVENKRMVAERVATEKVIKNNFYDVNDVVGMLNVSRPKAYAIMRTLNMELADQGYIVVSGKVSSRYFNEKLYI